MTKATRLWPMLGAAALVMSSVASAQVAPAGARPNDKAMTCGDIAAERTAISDQSMAKDAKRRSGQKVKKGLFGFAKTFAGLAIPGVGLALGGGSMLGSIAAQTAGQSAANAMNSAGNSAGSADAAPREARFDKEQQARLDRLSAIAAYRQCAA